ncbi:OprD family porin [Ectopseudomonas khazarica]|uniref:OprD family porin n=1 Tax=Ectopseudomonas khazarica TaxID=2502979 RepID=UPI00106EBB55|nr:OprD family porin [Pseudomonas khazarica]
MHNNKKLAHTLAVTSLGSLALSAQAGGFVEDAKLNLQTQNYYFNRDFREGTAQSKREEWAQGFALDFRSGYTPGTIRFGVDAVGLLGIKLDSARGRAGSGLLPVHDDGEAADAFSRVDAAVKARMGQSELRAGILVPKLPTLQANTGRIIPQAFQGAQASIADLKPLTFTLAHFDRVIERDSVDRQSLSLNNKNRRFSASAEANALDIAGVEAKLADNLALNYQFARLDDIYDQQFLGLTHQAVLGAGKFKSDLRYLHSGDSGRAAGGEIDSDVFAAMFTYSLAGHALGLGYQRLYGDTSLPFVSGSDPYLVNYIQINDFAEPGERSWQLRYDYDFGQVGIPGLTFMTRYIRGDHADGATISAGDGEWERNTDVQYVIQSGPLKALAIRWRNASYRSDFARDADENRLILSYSIPLL